MNQPTRRKIPSGMLRRDFVRLACAVPAVGALPTSVGCASAPAVRMGPFVGLPTADGVSLWCEGDARALRTVNVEPSAGGPSTRRTFASVGDGLFRATFDGLLPDTEYVYAFRDRAGTDYEGSFRTLPPADGVLRLAFGADIHPASAPYHVFDAIREFRPHLFVSLGDQVYADLDPRGPVGATSADYDELYHRTWDDPSLRACWANAPTLLVWDDHEVWNDFDGTFATDRIEAARYAYERYQRSRSPDETVWSELTLGPAALFVVDTRSHRAPNAAPDGPTKSMLGSAQLDALLAWIANTTSSVCILASPTPFHPHADTGTDAWAAGFGTERQVILAAIEEAGAERFVLVSGDQHWAAVVRQALPAGGSILELQCTPLAAFSRVPPASPSSDFLYVGDGSSGYGALEIEGDPVAPRVSFAWRDASGAEKFRLELR